METSRDYRWGIGRGGLGRIAAAGEGIAAAVVGIVDVAGRFVVGEERCIGFGSPGEGEGCCRSQGAVGCSYPVDRGWRVSQQLESRVEVRCGYLGKLLTCCP